MRSSPDDKRLGDYIKRAARSCSSKGEGIYFVGFSWEPHAGAGGPSRLHAASVIADFYQGVMCWRAVVTVASRPRGARVTVLDVSGDKVYALSLSTGSARWVPPEVTAAADLKGLARL